jgi:hypothetical protein
MYSCGETRYPEIEADGMRMTELYFVLSRSARFHGTREGNREWVGPCFASGPLLRPMVSARSGGTHVQSEQAIFDIWRFRDNKRTELSPVLGGCPCARGGTVSKTILICSRCTSASIGPGFGGCNPSKHFEGKMSMGNASTTAVRGARGGRPC